MSDKINKSSIEEAKANFEEIKKFALDEATKNLQEDVSKKVVEIMNQSMEGEVVQEEVTINADGTTIVIDDEGNVEVDAVEAVEGGEMEIEPAGEPIEMDSEEIEISDDEDEIEIDNSEIEEMNLDETNFEEQEVAAPAPAAEAPVEAPVEEMPAEMPAEEMPAEEMPVEDEIGNPFAAIGDKLDTLISMMGGEAGAAGEDIEIVDDAGVAPAPEAAPAPAAPVAEEITFEVVNNEMEIPEMATDDDILEVVDEEDTMEEVKMMGQSHTVQKSTGTSAGPEAAVKNRERLALKENKAQHEAKLAELIKENDSLKSELDKFESGFIKLQEQFESMQDYNAKLVMAYKVAMSGGLTTDEKVQISEQFDQCETVKDAENLYKSIVNEHQIKVNKNPEKAIKSNTVKTVHAKSTSQPLYESREISRMKQLAGIKNLNE